MTRNDIIRMAREAGLPYMYQTGEIVNLGSVERFAAIVAATEREACAEVVDDFGDEWMCDSHMLSKIIRARGNE